MGTFSKRGVTAAFFLSMLLAAPAWAEEATYNDADAATGVKLQTPPSWYGGNNALFPGTTAAPGASGNSVIVDYDPTVSGVYNPIYVLGGLSENGDATNNTVNISDGEIGESVFGGYSYAGNAMGNTVNISGGEIGNYVFGGHSEGGNVTNNTVTISDGVIWYAAYGGYAYATGNVTGNTVTISGGKVSDDVYGGLSEDGNATNNTVNISGGEIEYFVYGGLSENGDATNNTVNISGGEIGESAFGGYSEDGNATGNTVNISGGTIGDEVHGGFSNTGDATNNTVNIFDGAITTAVTGGFSNTGDVTGNTVNMSGGEAGSVVLGGYSSAGNATDNTVNISGGEVTGDVYGGLSDNGNATGNTVNIAGSPNLSAATLYGGDSSGGDVFTGNTLNVNGFQGSIVGAGNFEFYNFTLPAGLANGGVLLTSSNSVDLTDTHAAVVGVQPGSALNPGDTVTLIDNTTNAPLASSGAASSGLLLYQFSLFADSGALLASLNSIQTAPSAKALLEGSAARLGFLAQGADLAAGAGMGNLLAMAREGGLGAFGAFSGGWSQYDTGSHADVSGFSLLAGLGWQAPGLSVGAFRLGAFFEAGWGGYDSYNSFANLPSVDGDGNTSYYGGGLLGRMDFAASQRGNAYAEASLRMGQADVDFNSANLGYGWGASYDSSSMYYGAHAGLGYLWALGEKPLLDTYVKYLWTHQDSDNLTVAGEPVRFDAVDSQRLRAGARLSVKVNEAVAPYIGAAYEYEFDGKAGGNVRGYAIDATDLSGSTGMGELGINVQPAATLPLYLDLGVQGYVGQRQGVSGSLQVKWRF